MVVFYVQWLVVDDRHQSARVVEKMAFPMMVYEKVRDDHGATTAQYMRSFISAAEINRPAFVIPQSIQLAGGALVAWAS